MILPKDQLRRVQRGERTQTLARLMPDGSNPFVPGTTYAVQTWIEADGGPPKPSGERLRVRVDVAERIDYEDLTADDVQQQGFDSRDDLIAWLARHYAGRPLLRVRFRIDRSDRPRFLRSGGGYTTNAHQAMRDEPECVDTATLDRLAEDGRRRHAAREEADTRTLEAKVADLRRAEANGADVGRQIAQIERAVRAAERKQTRRAA